MPFSPQDLRLPARFTDYRKGQQDAILELASTDKRFSLLSAPTGSGKSLIYLSLARLLDARTLILVGTKGLQQQLLTDFTDIGLTDIRGHNNYSCAADTPSRRTTPSTPRDSTSQLCTYPPAKCHYRRQLSLASKSSLVITNYAYWITLAKHSDPSLLGTFSLLVLDEAHTAPEWLSRMSAIELDRRETRSFTGLDLPDEDALNDPDSWHDWATHALTRARHEYRERLAQGTRKADLQDLESYGKELAQLVAANSMSTPWVGERIRSGAQFTPVWPDEFAEPHLFRGVDRVVLSSATLSPDTAKYLDIHSDSYHLHEVPSSFPAKRRPFIFLDLLPRIRIDRRITDSQKREVIRRIDTLISTRLDRKAIIHTRSYSRSQWVIDNSQFSNIMITHSNSRGLKRAVKDFKSSSAPSILVSPSIEEGFDFPQDECEYQIILKVPFLDSRDPVTSARTRSDKSYANYTSSLALVQMYGRAVRSRTDSAECFILDDHWRWFKGSVKWPKWFRKSWRTVNVYPKPIRKWKRKTYV